jgi:starch phosphorylase
LIVAGKAHPQDDEGKRLVQEMTRFAARSDVWNSVVFLEDYDIALAQYLVAGIDIWLNTPRRPWEACGTSGMKVLVNGGLNLSELDGWWAEAYGPDVGWALGDGHEHPELVYDAAEATRLYELLEQQVIPQFYDRDRAGLPNVWLSRIRASMARLTPQFSGNRMVREYVDTIYVPASASLKQRLENGGKLAADLEEWQARLRENWHGIRFGDVQITRLDPHWHFEAQIYFGEIKPDQVQVELYADPLQVHEDPIRIIMQRQGVIPGAVHAYLFQADCLSARPADHFTVRIVPFHPAARVPIEEQLILWQR